MKRMLLTLLTTLTFSILNATSTGSASSPPVNSGMGGSPQIAPDNGVSDTGASSMPGTKSIPGTGTNGTPGTGTNGTPGTGTNGTPGTGTNGAPDGNIR